MKIPDKRIRVIEAAANDATERPMLCEWGPDDERLKRLFLFVTLARTAIPELLAEREELLDGGGAYFKSEIKTFNGLLSSAEEALRSVAGQRNELKTKLESAESANAALREEIAKLKGRLEPEPPARRFGRQFTCPECGGHEWGTSNCAGPEIDMVGHCHSMLCRFSWSRQDDDKYMTPAKP